MKKPRKYESLFGSFIFFFSSILFNQILRHCSEITTPELYTWNVRINEDEHLLLSFVIISETEINVSSRHRNLYNGRVVAQAFVC